ncbi:hypothetical protein [Agrococcus sp. Ld7]|uniref:hypothetical protein n=1 Tax=Agrococcus sp. Ld7 TaxID=649148 RepID=UPI00386F2477
MSKKDLADALGISRPTLDRYIRRGWVRPDVDGALDAMTSIDPDLALIAPASAAASTEIALNGTFSIRASKVLPGALRPGVLALVSPALLEQHTVLAIEVLWQRSGKLAMPASTGDDITAEPSDWALRALEASQRVDQLSSTAPGMLVVMQLGESTSSFHLNATIRRAFYEDVERLPLVTRRKRTQLDEDDSNPSSQW